MFTITKPEPNRVDIAVSGELDSGAMDTGLRQLLTAADEVEDGRMLYTITSISMPTVGALGVELQYLPKLFRLLGKFDKCAVVADASWVRTIAEVEGAMAPGLEIKAFMPSEHGAAEAWLAA